MRNNDLFIGNFTDDIWQGFGDVGIIEAMKAKTAQAKLIGDRQTF